MSRLCHKNFNSWMLGNKKYLETYKKIGSPKPFDVSLRDGIQSMKSPLPTIQKTQIYNSIVNTYNPISSEVGSLVSPKVLPIFADSLEFYKYCINEYPNINHYLLVPNSEKIWDKR